MFASVGVKIDLDIFVDGCKKLFRNFESDLAKYTTDWLKDNENEDEKYAIFDFLGDKANHYFGTTNLEKDITIFQWSNNTTKPTIVFGISVLTCHKEEAMKSLSFNIVNACIEEMKMLIKHFDIDENKIELILENY